MQRQQLQNNRKESPCDEPEVVLCRRAVLQIAQGPSGGLELSPGGAPKVCFSPQTKPAYLQRGTPETSARPAEHKRDTAAPGPPGGAAHQRKASLPQQAAERAPSSPLLPVGSHRVWASHASPRAGGARVVQPRAHTHTPADFAIGLQNRSLSWMEIPGFSIACNIVLASTLPFLGTEPTDLSNYVFYTCRTARNPILNLGVP